MCKSIRSKVVSISNVAHDNIGKTSKDDFIKILTKCLDIIRSIDISLVSSNTKEKYEEDIDTMSNNIKDADDTYLLAIASKEDICWYCGEKATHQVEKKYEKKTEKRTGYKTKQVTTFTKTIKLNVCDRCQHENDIAGRWATGGIITAFIIECLIAIWFKCNTPYGFEWNWDWVLIIIIGNIFLYWIV